MSIVLPSIVKKHKRIGRGIGGRGSKSGRGMKGQKSRAGFFRKKGFEGGQTPLYMRLPKKRGSKQISRSQGIRPVTITVKQLTSFDKGQVVGPREVKQLGHARYVHRLKIIGKGRLDHAFTVRAHAITQSARSAIESAGGKVEIIE